MVGKRLCLGLSLDGVNVEGAGQPLLSVHSCYIDKEIYTGDTRST